VEQTARKREAGIKKAASSRRSAADRKADRRRLETIEAETEALDLAEGAATATDEAARLSEAAAKAKRRRTG
jgi:hypothetical protein